MPTIETKIWQALRARVATITGYDLAWPLTVYEPRDLPYLEIRHLPNTNVRIYIGSDEDQSRPGILQLTICWPASNIGSGNGKIPPDNLIQRAGLLAELFPTDDRLKFDDVQVRIERAPDIAQPMRDGAYWRVPVSVRYSCFA